MNEPSPQKRPERQKPTPHVLIPCKRCGREAEIGAHGFRGGELYDEYYCEKCWNWKIRL